ncbi:TadE/TadG family type IV pilus assembly protein [Rothia sp. P7181]|uniref:TadE/TadG family type IV pilus assembly protein n=1 Tax=unclassified Rothia (in: high G+C Gram-positive bacteria) TaxID=2689056 RepID=UPI003ACF304C
MKTHQTDEGAITAEFAVALPAVIFVLAFVLGASSFGVSQMQLEDCARVALRAVVRGQDRDDILRVAQQNAPDASVRIEQQGNNYTVYVSRPAPGIFGEITGWTLESRVQGTAEKSVGSS